MNTKLRLVVSICAAFGLTGHALAQTNYTILRSFGFAGLSASNPGSPVVDADGVVYCTALTDQAAGGGAVLRVLPGTSEYEVIHRFDSGAAWRPVAIIVGSDEMLYGVTHSGGRFGNGTVFRLSKDGSGFAVVLEVDDEPTIGSAPHILIEGADGNLYVLTYGDASHGGSLFRIGRSGNDFALLHTFGSSGDGVRPVSLVDGSDGMIYGTTAWGGAFGSGTIFRIGREGGGYAMLKSFSDPMTEGQNPNTILQPRNGFLFGTTQLGGAGNWGTVFRYKMSDGTLSIMHHFQHVPGEGLSPSALAHGEDDWLYGTTRYGGGTGDATIFKLRQDGSGYQVIRASSGSGWDEIGINGLAYNSSERTLVYTSGSGGWAGFGGIFEINPSGEGYRILTSLNRNGGDGNGVEAPLLLGSDGFLYGTTKAGGKWARGTVFRMRKDGSDYRQLHSFGAVASDGRYPEGGLLEGADGSIYGTTLNGGDYGPEATHGAGTIFKISKNGSNFEVVHKFDADGSGGRHPKSTLIADQSGVLYGVTYHGGTAYSGTIYRINSNGSGFQTLHHFQDIEADGSLPEAGLLLADDGMLYGATTFGPGGFSGCLYRLQTNGTGYEIIHKFDWFVGDGQACKAALLQGSDGRLYGSTSGGGSASHGTVFRMNLDGTGYQIIKHFDALAGTGEGRIPAGSLVEGNDGKLYGITNGSGLADAGTVYRLNKDGTGFQTIRHFRSGYFYDGSSPHAGLIKGPSGAMFGTTSMGGNMGFGTAYALFPQPVSWFTGASRDETGTLRLFGRGTADRAYQLLGSSGLGATEWDVLGTVTAFPSGELKFEGIIMSDLPTRFFRIVTE